MITIKPINGFAIGFALATALSLSACASLKTSDSSNSGDKKVHAKKIEGAEAAIEAAVPSFKPSRSGEVYLMRCLLNIFSRGMDVMAVRIRDRGVRAVSFNHADWKNYANQIIARKKRGELSYPVAIMGHSLGGNAAPAMANYLAANGVKVDLVVTYDPTITTSVGKDIDKVINYYLPNEKGTNVITKKAGFSGSLKNVNASRMDVSHTTIEKNRSLQNKAITELMKLSKKLPKKSKKKG